MDMMGYKQIGLVSIMSLSLAYILPGNFFIIIHLLISCILLYQTFQNREMKRTTYKVFFSLILLFFSVVIIIFYSPVFAILALVFYMIQKRIYLFKDH